MQSFSYPVRLAPDRRDGGYVVTFRDLPEAITQGDDLADALAQAADCLEEAMAGRIRRGDEIPAPSRPAKGQRLIAVPGVTAAKAALYLALRQTGTTGAKLASLLRCPERHVRRLLDPRHASRLPDLQRALQALGKQLVIQVRDPA